MNKSVHKESKKHRAWKSLCVAVERQLMKVGVFIIGAQKSGTTSLYHTLIQHPDVVGGDKKELHHFDKNEEFSQGGEALSQ